MTLRAVVRGVGHYLPKRVVPNAEFEKTLDTSNEWIVSRSGIERRHFAAEGQTTSDLAVRAAKAAVVERHGSRRGMPGASRGARGEERPATRRQATPPKAQMTLDF